MKKLYLSFLSLFLVLAALCQPYSKLWTSAYSDTTVSNTNISDMITDKNGNSYVAGYKIFTGDEYYQTHLFLLKVNAAGTQEWMRYFGTGRDSIDLAYALALDKDNNIYLTGKRVDTFCAICTQNSKISDVITMKYNAAGTLLWLNRYHDSAYHLAAPSDIQVAAGGAIVVTGNISTYNVKTGARENKVLVQKINPNGTTAWVVKQSFAVGRNACFDANDNIAVAGAYTPDNLYQTQKPLLFKLSAQGKLLWKDVFDETGKNGILYSAGCDAAGNIYANGQTDTLSFYNRPQILTLKYNPQGKRVWYRKEATGTTTLPHYYGDFAVSAGGTCYLTGTLAKTDVDDDWLTTAYNANGARLWQATHDDAYHGSDKPAALTADSSGNCYVTGYDYTASGNYSVSTLFYNSSGAPPDSQLLKVSKVINSFGEGIGTDSKGNVYTGGSVGYYNGKSPEIDVIKYGKKPGNVVPILNAEPLAATLRLYPNPVVNTLYISVTAGDKAGQYTCILTDAGGNTLGQTGLAGDGSIFSAQMDVHALRHGMYVLRVTNGTSVVTKYFMKE